MTLKSKLDLIWDMIVINLFMISYRKYEILKNARM